MVEIETFLKGADGGFMQVEACRTPPPDLDYIEGAIRLSVDGLEIIGTEEWDYVDQLWCYIAEMVTKMQSSGYAETYFPDQPIKLSFRAAGPRVLVTAKIGEETKTANASSADFLGAVKAAGMIFFRKMSELVPANSYAEAQQELSV
ncbi:hypothetical protein BX264_7120 [Streptomyces sp. 2333.5]|uniref:hypothetical protein n=1 Tax=unclassified Streptomyces TaxID=2593676 RepID=UPI000894CE54|nr:MULTISPECIES: hypothetical protein [unclassified Streptomyces]PJJ06580.1 hypothetical protein BX264_7120 [Streptomyces sp. 2333.5]SEE97164.1 hypothetical protein SAMN05428943_7219 [Streptomyces sp. 2314.4]SEF11291.1 hypothetical protein SAMN05428942_7220 [Streptomyces sp. 2112.2]